MTWQCFPSPPSSTSLSVIFRHLPDCFEGNPFKIVPCPFKLFYRCMQSKPGEEPTEHFYYLQLYPPKREEVKLEWFCMFQKQSRLV